MISVSEELSYLGDLWNKFDACQDQNYLAVIEHFKKLKKLSD